MHKRKKDPHFLRGTGKGLEEVTVPEEEKGVVQTYEQKVVAIDDADEKVNLLPGKKGTVEEKKRRKRKAPLKQKDWSCNEEGLSSTWAGEAMKKIKPIPGVLRSALTRSWPHNLVGWGKLGGGGLHAIKQPFSDEARYDPGGGV